MTTEQQEIVRNQIEGYRQLYLKDGNPILVNFRTLVPKLNKPERYTHLIHPYPAKLLANFWK